MAVARDQAYIAQDIVLKAEFRQPVTSALFDPAAIDQVEIIDTDGLTVLQVVVGAAIVRLSQGLYQVTGAGANYDAAGVYFDRWTFRADPGDPAITATLQTVVAATAPSASASEYQMFRDLVPAAASETDEVLSRFVSYAALRLNAQAWGPVYEQAVYLLAGHMLTRARQTGLGAGAVTSERAGDLAVSYGNLAGLSGSQDAELLTTAPGAEFVALRKAHVIGAMVV